MKNIFYLALFFVVGCASETKVNCLSANWYQRGFQDALYGKPKNPADEFGQACIKEGIPLDNAKYDQGYQAGAKTFCHPKNAYQFGLEGFEYNGTCEAPTNLSFLQKYRQGRRSFLRQEISEKKELVKTIDEDIDFKEKLLKEVATREMAEWTVPTNKELSLSDEINKLRQKRILIESEIKVMAQELGHLGQK